MNTPNKGDILAARIEKIAKLCNVGTVGLVIADALAEYRAPFRQYYYQDLEPLREGGQVNDAEYRAEWLSSRGAPPSWTIITVDEAADAKAAADELRAEVARLRAACEKEFASVEQLSAEFARLKAENARPTNLAQAGATEPKP